MKKYSLLFLSLFISLNAFSQIQDAIDRFPFEEGINYDSSIPSPADYLGYELGEEYTFHYQIMGYFEELARVSDKITFHEYARSYENRSVNYAVITSSNNQNRIEEIQAANLELANNPQQ